MVVNGYSLDRKPSWVPGLGPVSFDPVTLAAFELDGRPQQLHVDGRTLTRQGGGSEEKKTGADILLVLETDGIDGLAPMKGILAQAKKNTGNFSFTAASDLFDQCQTMHEITDDSFAFIYAKNGFFLFDNPITQGVGVLHKRDRRGSIGKLVADFVDCRVGDTAISAKQEGPFAVVAQELRQKRYLEAAEEMEGNALIITAST
ncbi:hypothetical protein QA648_36355 (plasmid) [Rhizobium sp. CB3171]|uniref:hypothetical protein n=1 Tax=Rhizobium sp. CB3171 TaxID=3039157 RepID=UPI0024B24582|nr:hypothetical protein [Rhizobium sp. CB3171]WFU07486.1 hypothetical protein QA648_36355 [Rhizobium sp. CB3171]